MKIDARHEKLARLLDQGRFDELEARTGDVLRNRPHDGPLWYLSGIGRLRSGRLADARQAFEQAVQLLPGYAQALNNLGSALYSMNLFPEAICRFQEAILADASLVSARRNLSVALQAAHRNREAIEILRQVILDTPNDVESYKVLGSILLNAGRAAEAADAFESALRINPQHLELASFRIFSLQHLGDRTAEEIFAAAKHYGSVLARTHRPSFDFSGRRAAAEKPRRPRIGLVSGDFGEHPVGTFLKGVIAAIDKDRLDLVAFSNRPQEREDSVTEKLRAEIPAWHNIYGWGDEAVAQLIYSLDIDVLVDLNGHTDGERLGVFALRPAPIQVTWLWYSSTGLDVIDYILADDVVLPPEEEPYFTERPWRLPDGYYCYSPPDLDLSPGALPVLTRGEITFACFNRRIKLTTAVIDCWSEVLKAVPQSRLFVKCKELGDAEVQDELAAEFRQRGIGNERLRFEGPSPRRDYFAAYQQVDIALDPFCFTGGTTTLDGLWMGVPCVSLAGKRFIGHQGETILYRAGLSEWVAGNIDDYIAIAVRAAGNVERLAHLRAALRHRLLDSPICNAPRFARNLEDAFQGMVSAWLTP